MGSNVPLFPEAASAVALRVDGLFYFWLAMSLFFAVLIFVAVPVLAIKFRRRPENQTAAPITGSTPIAPTEPTQPHAHGTYTLEIAWSVIPFVLAMVLFGWGAMVFFHIYRAPDDAMNVNVVGKRWMWKLQHPNGKREINELHVPVGSAVKLRMTSEDVIHSFYVPAFRVKMDVLPGRYTTLSFRPVKTGRYHLFCAEYCGNEHSKMGGWVEVMEPEDFQQWLSGGVAAAPGQQVSPAAAGAGLFTKFACATCHRKPGPGEPPALAPNLEGVYGHPVKLKSGETVTVDETYIRRSILEPLADVVEGYNPIMPTFKGQLDEDQINSLIEYIKSLKSPDASGAQQAPAPGGKP